MFGRPSHKSPPPQPTARPAASDVARIQGGGLSQVIVTHISPLEYFVFLNDRNIPQIDMESISLAIEATNDSATSVVRATAAFYATDVSGQRLQSRIELFPGTLEIVALGRRLSVTCTRSDSLEGLWINLGLRPDGSSGEVTGAKSLRVLIMDGIIDAKLTWNDGEVEDLLPAL